MDVLEFLARSEWPIVVGGALWLLRKPISAMIGRVNLTKIDAWGFKAEFEKGLQKVEALTSGEPTKVGGKIIEARIEDRIQFRDSADANVEVNLTPELIVLHAWGRLESAMRKMIDAERPQKVGNITIPPLKIEEAAKQLGLSDDEIESLRVLRRLRNEVAHSANSALTWSDATRFRQATDKLLAKLTEKEKTGRATPGSG